jgi:drug/metabolite transporter (DMT)-like permease
MWLLYAFAGPVSWAASMHIDKYLLEKYFKHGSVAVSMVFTAIIGLLTLPFIALFVPGVFHLDLVSVAVMIVSGLLYMGGLLFYLQALQTEEASVVGMLSPVGPVLAFILAFLFLGERLTIVQAGGGALVIAGAFLASLRFSGAKVAFRKRSTILMTAAILCISLSSLIFKYFAVAESFWPATYWTYVGEALFGIVILLIPSERRTFVKLFRTNPRALLMMNALNEIVNLGGSLAARYALVLAPLALVQAVTSTTPLFSFIFGILITVFLPKLGRENISKRNLIQKSLAAILVVAGAILAGGS